LTVCGVDVGSLRTASDVAWLQDRTFALGSYVVTADEPLPPTPDGLAEPSCYAFDAPQGLPCPGARRREADAAARTPTSVLPADLDDLATWKLYRGPVEAGIVLFEALRARGEGSALETYPQAVARRLWPGDRLPVKRRDPAGFAAEVVRRLRAAGYRCDAAPVTVDQADAMLCAVAAEAWVEGRAELLGAPAEYDGHVLREGYIVVPMAAPKLRGIDHVVIAVSDFDRSGTWYREVLGAEVEQREAEFARYRFGDWMLNVHAPSYGGLNAAKPVEPGNSDLCLVWDGPLEDAIAHLEGHGVEIVAGPVEQDFARGQARSVYFRDPDGSLLEFVSYE
jgi:catechol 2,3-dioxygenase-like lactoylglutathione lyase family enzyme/predicted nuclease with RNAse H fold